jgi:hypothetical protein
MARKYTQSRGLNGVRLDPKHQERTRAKIKTSEICQRLEQCFFGKVELTQGQLTSARLLLDKTLPNLTAQELTGDSVSFVMRLPEPAVDTATWERTNSVASSLPNTDTTKH